jgi:hypothetical protein
MKQMEEQDVCPLVFFWSSLHYLCVDVHTTIVVNHGMHVIRHTIIMTNFSSVVIYYRIIVVNRKHVIIFITIKF